MKIWRLAVALLLAALLLSLLEPERLAESATGPFGSARASGSPESPTTTPTVRLRSRFTTQTSAVWRYGSAFVRSDLAPVPNNHPHPEPQPDRARPERVALNAAGTKAYISLAGTEAAPGNELAVIDLATREVIQRIEVGSRPYQPVMHPGGRFLVVTNELSNYASVVDTTLDDVVSELPLDYYCQGLVFSADGSRAWVANRYLDQVLMVDIEVHDGWLDGAVRVTGGFDEARFFGSSVLDGKAARSSELLADLAARGLEPDEDAAGRASGGINAILRARCGACHTRPTGGFVAGPDPVENLLSAVENAVGGDPLRSQLLRSVIPESAGGFRAASGEHHAGGVVFSPGERDLVRLTEWIQDAGGGPGIEVGNRGSHPKDVVLSGDGRHLYVGNTGTMDVSVVSVEAEREVAGLYLQNVANHLVALPTRDGRGELLVALTMGVGFGAARARDPAGGETWDREAPEAQFTTLRDGVTTDVRPLDEQAVMGPYDAVDGTANLKMRDIQNDLVLFDLRQIDIPRYVPGADLDYLVKANAYESHPQWVRYTSDTAEATGGDIKGDIAPELQRVPGSFPSQAVRSGDRLFVTMSGSFEVVEWLVDDEAADPALRMTPMRVYDAGLRPVGLAVTDDVIIVANQLGESVSIIDRQTGVSEEVRIADSERPPLDTDAEKGELVAHTSSFTSDRDTSCLHCHFRDTGDGRGWGAAETVGQDRQGDVTAGGTLGIPQMRNVFAIQPFYFEGTHRLSEGQGADINEPASVDDFDRPVWAGDYTHINSPVPESKRKLRYEELKERVSVRKLGSAGYDLEERRDAFIREQSLRHFGAAYGLKDLYRFTAAFMGDNNHLLPNPFDQEAPAVRRGERLFHHARVMCSVCHTAPEFTNKGPRLTHNDRKALPQLTTVTRRDASYTLASVRAVEVANGEHNQDLGPTDRGRVETEEGSFTTMQLRGIFDRPPVFLHHGRARSLREVIASPNHPGLRRFRLPVLTGPEEVRAGRHEVGFNETTSRFAEGPLNPEDRIVDTHGGTSHLTARQLDDLVAFMRSIE